MKIGKLKKVRYSDIHIESNINTMSYKIKDCFFITMSLSLFYGIFLNSHALFVPDGGRYAELGFETARFHHWIIPHLNGIIYLEKPPLYYWLTASSFNFFGFHDWVARLPNLFLCVFQNLFLYWSCEKLFNRKTALTAVALFASMLYPFALTHLVITDIALSTFLSCALLLFILQYYRLAFIFSALAVLTKGLIGLLFPCMIVGLWIVFYNKWFLLKEMKLFSCITLFILVVLPWHLLAQNQIPDFFHFYILEQQFLRFLTPIAERSEPFWFFIPIFILGTLPWTGFVYNAFKTAFSKKDDIFGFLLIWSISIFLFFSISQSKLIPYILPIFIPIAILTAYHITNVSNKDSLIKILFVIALVTFPLLWKYFPLIEKRSVKPFAVQINKISKPTDNVAVYGHYYQDLPFYTQRKIIVIDWLNEFQFGVQQQNPSWIVKGGNFWKKYNSKQTWFFVMRNHTYKQLQKTHHLYLISTHNRDVLVSNKENIS